MLGSRLVVRGVPEFILKFPNLLLETAHCCQYKCAGEILINVYSGNCRAEERTKPESCSDYLGGSRTGDREVKDRYKVLILQIM